MKLKYEILNWNSKTEWVVVRKELIDEKGIEATCADKIGEYAKLNGD